LLGKTSCWHTLSITAARLVITVPAAVVFDAVLTHEFRKLLQTDSSGCV
jgi:hypothetical protein